MALCFCKLSKLPSTACLLQLSSRVLGAGNHPILQNKLEATKDAWWTLEKIILGFVIDGAARTVKLHSGKADDLAMTTSRLLAG